MDLLEALLEEPGPVGDGTGQEARENKVKRRGVFPAVLEVVDKEVRIGWDTEDVSVGVLESLF